MNKPFYKKWWGIILIIFFFPFFFTYLIWKKSNWSVNKRLGLITGMWILFLVMGALNPASRTPKHEQSINTGTAPTAVPTQATIPTEMPKPKYEVKKHEVKATVENFEVLIQPGADGKAVAKDVQKTCQKPCNIYIWDDEKALNLQLDYDKMDVPERTAWTKKNYVFVADHLVGNVEFELPDNYDEYPFRDWQYKELKGQ